MARADDLNLASTYVEAGRLAEAVAILKKYQASEEEEPRLNFLTGKIYLAIDKPEKALEFFELADVQSVDNLEIQASLALCQLRLGKFAIAKRYADSIGRAQRDSGEPLLINSLIQARTGKLDVAIKEIEQAAQRQPDSQNITIARAKFHVATGSVDKARATLMEFLKRQPEAASALAYLSEVHQKLGNSPAAIETRAGALKKFAEQGNQDQAQVMRAWLEVNDPAFQTELASEHTSQPGGQEQVIEARPQTQAQPEVVKINPPISESEQTFAVQRFPFPANVVITGGSGFIVDSGRKVVTNRHVVEDGKEFAIRTGLGEVIKAKVVFLSKTDDLAILELDKPLPSERAIPNTGFVKPKVGRNVVVMGYPLWYILGEGSPSLTNGVVSKRTGLSDDQATFQITAKVNKGNSGGPVFDMRGNVVGITVGKLDLKKISDDQGFLPEDVNFAIHVDRLPKSIGMAASTDEAKDELSAEELYQAMVGKVVMVATYK